MISRDIDIIKIGKALCMEMNLLFFSRRLKCEANTSSHVFLNSFPKSSVLLTSTFLLLIYKKSITFLLFD